MTHIEKVEIAKKILAEPVVDPTSIRGTYAAELLRRNDYSIAYSDGSVMPPYPGTKKACVNCLLPC